MASRSTDSTGGDDWRSFEAMRPRLLGLAYRILGSLAEAEDAVQDTFLKWAGTDRDAIQNPTSWLTTACTRRCLDLLRSAHRTRVEYVGPWLPEPIHASLESEMETGLELAQSLTMAFLLVLERLTPKERAAYLLHDIFDTSYREIAATLDMQESACRKLVSRAKANIDGARVRHATSPDTQNQLLAAFQQAITSGVTEPLAVLLSDDIRLSTDGGGKVPALLDILKGKTAVISFLSERLHDYWAGFQWAVVDLNGARGIALSKEAATVAAVSFACDESGKATDIYIVRNPDKLALLGEVTIR